FKKATKKIIDFFLSTGHKQIGFIGGQESIKGESAPIDDLRKKSFQSYLESFSLYDDRFVFVGKLSVEAGYELMKQSIEELGDELPTAFFVISDVMAIGCLRALHESEIAIPERASLIGINDIDRKSVV